MSTKTLACFLVGLLLLLSALLFIGDGGAREPGVIAAAAQAGAEPALLEELAPASVIGAGPMGPDDSRPVGLAEEGRELVAAPGPQDRGPAGEEECVVLVLDEEEPVAEARLLFFRVERMDESLERMFWDLEGIDLFLERNGSEVLTDENGLAAVPDPGEGVLLVAAYADGLFGRETFDLDEEQPWRLEVERDATFLVRVVDASGTGVAGVGTCLRSFSYGSPEVVLRARTDVEGLARLAHAGDWLGREDVVLAIDAPLHPPVEHALPPAEEAQEVVRLTLPPSASLAVEVVESDGRPFTGKGELNVSVVPPGESRKANPWGQGDRVHTRYELQPQVRIPYVQCGAELALSAVRGGASQDSQAFVTVPASPGASGRARLVLGADHPVCAWRLVDGAGMPLAERSVEVLLVRFAPPEPGEEGSSRREEELRETDGDGRLVLDLPPWQEGEARVLDFFDASSDPPRSARVGLDHPLPPGLHEGGDVVLELAPLFVAGRVIGLLGEPVPGARLFVERHGTWGWWRDWSLNARADDQGAFSWRFPAAPGEWRIVATADEGSSVPIPFRVGERDVSLQIEALGEVAGRFLLGEPIAGRNSLHLRLEQADEQAEAPSWNAPQTWVEEDGAFLFREIRPGRYRVQLQGSGWNQVLYRSPELVVSGGRTSELPVLDLRSVVHRFRIELVPPRPDPALTGQLELRSPEGEHFATTWWDGQPSELFTLEEHAGARIFAYGYRVEVVEPLLPENRVALRLAPRVRVRLTGGAELPPAPYELGLSLALPGERVPDWSFTPFDEDREVVVQGVEPGSSCVVWLLHKKRPDGSSRGWRTESDPLQMVEIADVPGEQTVVVRLDELELKALLSRD